MDGLANGKVYRGHARFTGPRTVSVNGHRSKPTRSSSIPAAGRSFPAMPGLDGVPYFTNSTMIEVDFVPAHLLIVGGSYIGLEFAQAYRRFGSR